MNKITAFTLIILGALGLSACGGGGGAGPVIEITNPVDTAQDVYDSTYDAVIEAELTPYQASTVAAVAASHHRGWDGDGVEIAIVDGFTGNEAYHGETVKRIVEFVAPDATIHEADNGVPNSDAIDNSRVDWRILRTANVVNHSYGGNTQATYNNLIRVILEDGVDDPTDVIGLQVVAAGNEHIRDRGYDGNQVARVFINNEVDTIVVGSINPEGTELIGYSNVAGDLADHYIAAPELEPGGTSYAAPTVTGTAALIMDKFGTSVGPEATKRIILQTADDLGEAGVDRVYGHGRLNIGRALSPVGNLR